jgi:autotransporter-associated beta strand protein
MNYVKFLPLSVLAVGGGFCGPLFDGKMPKEGEICSTYQGEEDSTQQSTTVLAGENNFSGPVFIIAGTLNVRSATSVNDVQTFNGPGSITLRRNGIENTYNLAEGTALHYDDSMEEIRRDLLNE